MLAVLLAVGGTLSVLAGTALREAEELRARELRTAATQSVLSAFDLDLTRTIEAVRGAGLMIETNPQLSRAQFNHYVERVLVNLHSINFMEWQPIVVASRLRQFEAAARASGIANYRVIQPNGTGTGWEPVRGRAEYVPVLYTWPERFGTTGYDMSFSPERMESKRKAAVVGQPVASGVFEIMKEGTIASGSMGIAVSVPVYGRDQSPIGYLAAIVDLPTLFRETTLRADGAKLDLMVYDLGSPQTKPIYAWLGDESDLTPAATAVRTVSSRDQASTVDVARQAWEIVLHPRPSFDAARPTRFSTGVMAAGLITTALLLLAVARVQRSRQTLEQAQVLTQQTRERLAEQRQRLQNIIEATDVGTWEVNFITGQADVNDRFLEIGGMSRADWQALDHPTWKTFCHPDDQALVDTALRRHTSGEASHYEAEYRHRHTDGHWVWVASKGRLLMRTADGKPEVFAGTLTEITDRKMAQARIVELNATLERRVQERTAQLEAAMQTLRRSQEELSKSEARATLGTLVAGVSHEMSTPLGNSMMTASTLVDQARDFERRVESNQLRRSDLSAFMTQVGEGSALLLRNLQRAVDLLKSFRQVAADQASEQRRVFDLRQAVQEVVDTMAPGLKSQPHRIVQDVAADISMDSYPGPLGQVVINLVNNAYLHAFDGVAEGRFTIRGHSDGDWVTLTFEDNGKGIAPKALERMFEPFFSTKIGKGGTGLGMSIVKNLVTKTLGGRLAVQSTPGVGTTVVVELPKRAPLQGGE